MADPGRSNRARLRVLAEGIKAPEWTVEEFERIEFERVRFSLFTAVVAESIPRRLGKDADAAALAIDKRVARMVANCYRSLWMSYSRLGAPPAPTWSSRVERVGLAAKAEEGMRRAGATVRWGPWLRDRHGELDSRTREVAALAMTAGRPKWGVRRVRILTAERDNIERIAGEVVRRRTT